MSMCLQRGFGVAGVFLFVLAFIAGASVTTPLDEYVAAPDDTYEFGPDPVFTVEESAYTAKIWPMKSQRWLTEAEVDRPVWEHWLTIIEPADVAHNKAFMFIAGGSNRGDPPRRVDASMAQIAVDSKSIVAILQQIPNQPIRFADEHQERYAERGRSEDALIAYTWDKFMRTGDPKWPARLPMTKAVVRAMDTVQALHPVVEEFMVGGGSKRGWTTWTVAAVDGRVAGIAPAVIDVLNVEHSMLHHRDAYGFWAVAIWDYVNMDIMRRRHTPEFRALCDIVDPYSYLDRYTMPMYIINSTGDQFFLPDSSQFYFDALKGEKHLRYLPNTGHGLNVEAYLNMAAFYGMILNDIPRPKYGWKKLPDGSLRVTTDTKPNAVRMWQATNPNSRSFRIDYIGQAWTSTELADEGGGVYVARAPQPEQGWTAFMVELEYPSGGATPLKVTTEVSVVPQIMPFRNPGGWGRISSVGEGNDEITVVEVGGNRYEMGYWYGRLLADQIAEAWAGFIRNVEIPGAALEDVLEGAVRSLWNARHFDTAAWELELRGAADGCYDAGRPEVTFGVLQKMLAIADLAEHGCSLFAAWGKATANGDLYQLRNLDWTMTTGLQDYPVIAVYNPDDGKRHAVIGFAGMTGATVGGINDSGLGVSQIRGHFGDDETLNGIPFPVLLRDILYHDSTLDASLTRIEQATRTNEYHYAIADPAARGAQARLILSSNTRHDVYTDDIVVTNHPLVSPSPFHEKLEDALYWKKHNGGDNRQVYEALKERHGAIDGAKAIEVARIAGVEGTLVSIVYHNSANAFWVAFANGLEPAHGQEYVYFSLNENKQ